MTEPPEPGYDEFLDFNAPLSDGRADAIARQLAAGQPERIVDVVICVGSDHAYGQRQDAALKALHDVVRPGGRLLFGTGFWERPPTEAEAESIGMRPTSLHDLDGLVDLTIAAGYRPLFIQTANRDEWEQFEAGYLADWETWLVQYGDHPTAGGVREQADKHRNEWLHGWRNVLGFAHLTLGRPNSA